MENNSSQKRVRVCNGQHCRLFGARQLMEELETAYSLKSGEKNASIDLDYCACRGYCSSGPNVDVNGQLILSANSETLLNQIQEISQQEKKPKVIPEFDIEDDFLGDI